MIYVLSDLRYSRNRGTRRSSRTICSKSDPFASVYKHTRARILSVLKSNGEMASLNRLALFADQS